MSDALPSMTSEELGTLGERYLEQLCAQASMVSNPAKRDVHGFDNLIQLRIEHDAAAYDLAPSPVRCFIQVKATQKRSGSIAIRLTNWQHMIADREPWFVFVCEVNSQREISDLFLVHISEYWMEKALRRLRNCSAKGKPLGRKEMAITYGLGDRMAPVHAELRSRVLNTIGADSDAYRSRKARFYRTCGYSEETHRLTVRFRKKSMSDHYVDWTDVALGLRSDLDAEHIKVTDQRFGEAVVTSEGPISLFKMQAKPIKNVQLQLFNSQLGNHSTSAAVFSTAAVPHIPEELSKARLKMGPFSFIIETAKSDDHGDGTCSITTAVRWDYDEIVTIEEIGSAARTMKLMCAVGTRISLELSEDGEGTVEFWLGKVPVLSNSFESYLATVQAAATVCRYVGLEDLKLPSGELDHLPWPVVLSSCILEGATDAELTVPALPYDESRRPVLVVSCAFPLSEWVVFTCGALPLKSRTEEKFTFTTQGAENLGVWKVAVEQVAKFPIVHKQAEFVKRLESNSELAVFSVDPRTDEGMKTLISGDVTSKEDAPTVDGDENS